MARTYRSTPEPVYAQKSTELVKKDGSTISVDNLQEKLTFDTTPTKNSTNPVTSDGIKTYVDGLMSGALKRSIVETLPVEDIDTNTIYMVLDQSASQQGNVYNEYLYINNAWELIGTTATSGGIEVINLADVEELTQAQFYAIKGNQVKVTYDDIDLLLSKWDEENDYPILTSTVCDSEYLQVTFTEVNEDEVPYYTFEVETIPVGLHIVELEGDSGNVDLPLPEAFIDINSVLFFKSGLYVENLVTHMYYSSPMDKNGIYYLMDITMPSDLLITTATYVINKYKATVTPYSDPE